MMSSFLSHKIIKKFFLVLSAIFFISCSEYGTEFNEDNKDKWHGKLSVDFIHSILKPDGTVWGWGSNSNGTLGNGLTESSSIPVMALYLNNIISIDQSFGAEVALDTSGNIWFWGNLFIYFGPPNIDTNVVFPYKIGQIQNSRAISIDGIYIFVLTKDKAVWYIKLDWYSPTIVEGPTKITNLLNVVSLNKSLAVTSDGSMYDLHSGTYIQDNLRCITSVSGNPSRHVLALKKDGTVLGWGNNDLGQLGNGTNENSQYPKQVLYLNDIIEISANYDFNLALKKDGTVWFWGFCGQENDSLISQNVPSKIDSITDAVTICSGYRGLIMSKNGTYWLFNVNDKTIERVLFN